MVRSEVLRRNFDLAILLVVIGAFAFVGAQNLDAAPLPDTDESMTLQVSYEMLHRGKLAFPMYRYLGGNIENAWHSYTPVFFAMLAGFQKIFGWGLLQGRSFNLTSAALILLMVPLIGRKLFDWRIGLIAVVVLVSDPTFLDRSRIARNDYLAAMFGLVAFYLYLLSEEKKRRWLFVASGLAAGAGVMSHTNLLYMLAVIAALMVLKDGWRVIKLSKPYLFAAGVAAALAYEVVYDLLDYKNFLLQNREDPMHFRVLSGWGWWTNLKLEPGRYVDWHNGFLKIDAPLTLLHLFLYSAVAAGVYLTIRLGLGIKRGKMMSDPRAPVFVATVVVMLFFALITQRKIIQYVVHLAPWFALSVGILIGDALSLLARLRRLQFRWAKLAHSAAVACAALAVLSFGYELGRQNHRYLKNVNDPERASFAEIKNALRAVVPEDVCPVAVKSGFLWLAFPDKDYCFVAIESRMKDDVDIIGRDYALLMQPKRARKERELVEDLTENAHLIGELNWTAYGTFQIYYTGADRRYRSLVPKRYYFFGAQRGYVSDDQIAAAREVWSARAGELKHCAGLTDSAVEPDGLAIRPGAADDNSIAFCQIETKPQMIYQISADATLEGGNWELIVTDCETGGLIYSGRFNEKQGRQRFDDLFKTSSAIRTRVGIRPLGKDPASLLWISRISIREVAPV